MNVAQKPVQLPLTICAGLIIAIIMDAAPCRAIDYQPFDWIPAPPGTFVAQGYYAFGTRNEYNNTITGTFKNNTHLDSSIGVARFLFYDKVFDHPYVVDFLVPFGALTGGEINGNHLANASGMGDPTVSAGFWFINQPEHKRWLSAASFLSLPVGSYDNQRVLNLGNNRWQHDLQADFTQGFLDNFTIDFTGDWTYYGDNTEAGTGHQLLTQDSTFVAYSWLSYDITSVLRAKLPVTISVGYAGTFGGAQKLDGISNGAATREQQIRLTYSQFITPTCQFLISVNHDVYVAGQFKQDFGLLVRVTKTF